MFCRYPVPSSFFTFLAYVSVVESPCPNCLLLLYPHAYTSPLVVNANEYVFELDIFLTFVKYVFSSIFTCTCLLLFVVVPFPNWPQSFLPVAHTVPSSFNVIMYSGPTSICGFVIAPSLFLYTFIIAFAFTPVFELYPVIVV